MNIHEAFDVVGHFGKGQIALIVPACFACYILTPMVVLSSVFTLYHPEHHYNTTSGINETEHFRFQSFPMEYPEIGTRHNVAVITSTFMAGVASGNLIIGPICDKFGRKPVLFYSATLMLLCLGASGVFTTGVLSFSIWRFLTGFFRGGFNLAVNALMYESIGPESYRDIMLAFGGSWTMGTVLLVVVAWFFPRWRSLGVVISLLNFYVLYVVYRSPETPRWLFTHGKFQEAEDWFKEVGKRNGRKQEDLDKIKLKPVESVMSSITGDANKRQETWIDVLRSKLLVIRTLILMIIFFTLSLVYYGVSFGMGHIGTNIYTSMALSGITEFPSNIVMYFLMEHPWFGRRRSLVFSLLLAAIGSFTLDIFHMHGTTKLIVALFTKFAIAACWNVFDPYSAELLPSSVRGFCYGLCGFAAQSAGIIAPFATEIGSLLRKGDDNSAFILYGIFCLIAAVLAWFLPETLGRKTFDTVEDLDKFNSVQVESNHALGFNNICLRWFKKEKKSDRVLIIGGDDERDENTMMDADIYM